MQSENATIQSKDLTQAFKLLNQKKLDEAEVVLTKGLNEAKAANDKILQGVFYSSFGILFKLKKNFRKAWKYYEQAEKIIPADPALKIISSRLLADYFGQHDTVIRKMQKVIDQAGNDLSFLHSAYSLQGFSYLKKGNKKKALECLKLSMGDHFKGMQTAANLDYRLVEALTKKKTDLKACRDFLEQALSFAKSTREVPHQKILGQLLKKFPA